MDAVVLGTVVVAGTGVDEHDRSFDDALVGAGELDLGRLGAVRGAAASVTAAAAETRPVGLHAGAVLVGQVDGLWTPLGLHARSVILV